MQNYFLTILIKYTRCTFHFQEIAVQTLPERRLPKVSRDMECAEVFRRDIRKRRCLTSPTIGKGEFMHRYAEDKRERVADESLAHLCCGQKESVFSKMQKSGNV
jgi:hypothetical protein